MIVGSEQRDLRNTLFMVRGQGREPSGLNYAFDAAATSTELQPGDGFDTAVTSTELQPGDGSRLAGTLAGNRISGPPL
jgi:hypothetical protein